MELTSPSEAPSSAAEAPREVTTPSEEDLPPKGCGRGRGRGSSRGRAASSSNHPKPKRAIHKRRGRGKKSETLLSLAAMPKQPDDMEETSLSEETARIAAAATRTQHWVRGAEEVTSSEEDYATPVATDSHSMPKSSSVFAYATWLVGHLTEEQRQKLTCQFTWMDLCAGLGTPYIAYEALRHGMLPYGISPKGECTGLTEKSPDRRAALRRRAIRADSSAPIFASNSALTSRTPNDDQGNPRDLPIADHLFMGIVCVDISAESSTPKSLTDETGATGQCWLGFLAYLDLLHFEERPLTIVLECVQKLDHNRSVQGRIEKGTLLVIEALKERGYVGQWRKVSPTNFFCLSAVRECGLCS